MDLDKAIKSRTSIRKFSSTKKPDWRTIIECVDSARYAPIAGGNFILKFVLVSDSEKIRKIAESCQQNFITEAPYVLAVCSVPGRLINSYDSNGKIYARQQAGAAIQNILLKLEASGLSTCWIGYFVESQVKEILKVDKPKEVNVEAILPIGFSAETNSLKKNKTDIDSILYFNEYGETKMGRV